MPRSRIWLPWFWMAAVFVLLVALTWKRWANPIVDCGREMYLPWQISEGKMLYRDLFFMYGPLVPYWHALLFTIFGPHLNVLYAVGLTLTAAQAILLYQIGRRVVAPSLAVMAVVLYLVQFAFRPTVSNLVFPYSFNASYSCFLNLAALWFVLRHHDSRMKASSQGNASVTTASFRSLVYASVCVGLSLLAKHEIGLAGFVFVAAYALFQPASPGRRRTVLLRSLVCLTPSVAVPALGYGWFAWKLGVGTLFHEYLLPWKLLREMAFFEKYVVGTLFSPRAILYLLRLCVVISGGLFLVLVAAWAASRWLHRAVAWFLPPAVAVALVASPFSDRFLRFLELNQIHAANCFVLLFALYSLFRKTPAREVIRLPLFWVCVFALLATWRAPLFAGTSAYSTFYMAASVIVFARVWSTDIPALWGDFDGSTWRKAFLIAMTTLCVFQVGRNLVYFRAQLNFPITTARGELIVHHDLGPALSETAGYILRHTHPGEPVLCLPEETCLYFLCNRPSSSKYDQFLPPLVSSEARERAVIASAEAARVRIITISNRAMTEYGKPYFGLDYFTQFRQWLLAHYHLVQTFGTPARPIPPPPPSRYWPSEGYGIEVYERN